MPEHGMTITASDDMTRIQVTCEHQSGLIYVVPAERSWVCNPESIPAHALAGFFRELAALRDERVQGLMAQWGIYYRQLPQDLPTDAPAEQEGALPGS